MQDNSTDEVDSPVTLNATAPSAEDLEVSIEGSKLTTLELGESAPSAPIIEDIPTRTVVINQSISVNQTERLYFKQQDIESENTHLNIINNNKISPFSEQDLASLYNNDELSLVEPFINEFVEFQLRNNVVRQQHRLNELLLCYLRARNHLIVNSFELKNLRKLCKETQKQLWCLDKASVTKSGECQDGNPVSATHEYSIAHFNQQNLVALTKSLSTIKESLHNVQTLHCYESETLKLQIENYVQSVCQSCKEYSNLPYNAPVSLNSLKSTSQTTLPHIAELKMCITILFNFQRKNLKDDKFVNDTREWLSKLIAVLLRIASFQDHLFLLNHILRCPGGVASWAKHYIQIPVQSKNNGLNTSPFNDQYLDHMVAVLANILMPIKEREKFLEQVQITLQDPENNPNDTIWVILDEEGEEDEDITSMGMNLFESDLISFLYQIPLGKFFEEILYVENENGIYVQDRNLITEHHILRMFAFSTVIVRILRRGLQTYDSPRYRQLAKRLSAIIRDIREYLCHW